MSHKYSCFRISHSCLEVVDAKIRGNISSSNADWISNNVFASLLDFLSIAGQVQPVLDSAFHTRSPLSPIVIETWTMSLFWDSNGDIFSTLKIRIKDSTVELVQLLATAFSHFWMVYVFGIMFIMIPQMLVKEEKKNWKTYQWFKLKDFLFSNYNNKCRVHCLK